MRYKVIALVLMMVGLACQAQNQMDKQGRRQGHWVKTDKQGAKIYEGEFVTIMGTSGSGKSTLLNLLVPDAKAKTSETGCARSSFKPSFSDKNGIFFEKAAFVIGAAV